MDQHTLLYLLLKEEQGTLTVAEAAQLEQWYQSFDGPPLLKDDALAGIIQARIYSKITQQVGDEVPDLPPPAKVRGGRYYLLRFGAAAAVLLLLLAAWYFYPRPSVEPVALLESHTGIGKMKQILLPDGTSIRLNANSSLQYPANFNGRTREITLSGEAFFEVAQHPDQPFIVHTGQLQTVVLGTSFNIRAYNTSGDVRVHVHTGKVGVMKDSVSLSTLLPDEQLVYHVATGNYEKQQQVAAAADSWKSGVIRLDGASIAELALVLKNYYNYELKAEKGKAGAVRFTAEIYLSQPIEVMLPALCRVSGTHYRIQQRIITLY